MSSNNYLDHVTIVLYRPRFPENIGAAARAALNMGISRLVLVAPENCDLTRILRMATHYAADLVENMEVYADLTTALQHFHYVVGTTARTGGHRRELRTPREIAVELVPICANNQVALLFGPEDRGLTNVQLRYCHALVTVPTAGFSSLNLAQAVMILCYELLLAGTKPVDRFVSRLATRRELDGMYEHLKETLLKINFINPENPDYWMQNIRRFFSRVGLRARDVKIIRGICRQIDWYTKQRLETMQQLEKE
ncbi:MAG: RNA methyltransferase [Syntrophobacterales bacterium]